MNKKFNTDNLEAVSFFNGLAFFAPVALLVRTRAGISLDQFFILQAILSVTIFLGYSVLQMAAEKILDTIGEKNYFTTFVTGFTISGICMLLFGRINITLVIINIVRENPFR